MGQFRPVSPLLPDFKTVFPIHPKLCQNLDHPTCQVLPAFLETMKKTKWIPPATEAAEGGC